MTTINEHATQPLTTTEETQKNKQKEKEENTPAVVNYEEGEYAEAREAFFHRNGDFSDTVFGGLLEVEFFPTEPKTKTLLEEKYISSNYNPPELHRPPSSYEAEKRTDAQITADILAFQEQLFQYCEEENIEYKCGKSTDETEKHYRGIEISDITHMNMVQHLYIRLLDHLEVGDLRLPVWFGDLPLVKTIVKSANEGNAHFRDNKLFNEDFQFVIRNRNTLPLYNHHEGRMYNFNGFREFQLDPNAEIYYIECVSKKQQFIAECKDIDLQHSHDLKHGKCCICKKGLIGCKYGNNPLPVRKRGKCCNKCNTEKVIPARLEGYNLGMMCDYEFQILERKMMCLLNIFPRTYTDQIREDLGVNMIFTEFEERLKNKGYAYEINIENNERPSITVYKSDNSE